MPLPPDRDGSLELRHAGPLVGDAVDLHQALLADAHAAEKAAGLVGAREPQCPDASRGQGRREALAATPEKPLTFELECDRIGIGELAAASPQAPAHAARTGTRA